jgi:hypothetical protein
MVVVASCRNEKRLKRHKVNSLALDRSIEALKQGLKDLVEETSKYNKESN